MAMLRMVLAAMIGVVLLATDGGGARPAVAPEWDPGLACIVLNPRTGEMQVVRCRVTEFLPDGGSNPDGGSYRPR